MEATFIKIILTYRNCVKLTVVRVECSLYLYSALNVLTYRSLVMAVSLVIATCL